MTWTKNGRCISCGKLPGASAKNCSNDKHKLYYLKWKLKFTSRQGLREKALTKLCRGTPFCNVCRETDIRVLSVNHLVGSPKLPRKRELMQAILSNRIDLSLYDVRCANCQIRYEYEVGRMILLREKERIYAGLFRICPNTVEEKKQRVVTPRSPDKEGGNDWSFIDATS